MPSSAARLAGSGPEGAWELTGREEMWSSRQFDTSAGMTLAYRKSQRPLPLNAGTGGDFFLRVRPRDAGGRLPVGVGIISSLRICERSRVKLVNRISESFVPLKQ